MPADLRDAPADLDFAALPFRLLYLLDDEWAAEIANGKMRGVLHVGWVPDGTGAGRPSGPPTRTSWQPGPG
jgi:hypothetical protein